MNLYSYVANNPVKYVDPSGHEKVDLGKNVESSTSRNSTRIMYDDVNNCYYDRVCDYFPQDVGVIKGDPKMYSIMNDNGGTVVLSMCPINVNDFENTINYYSSQGKTINILSGTHGTAEGYCSLAMESSAPKDIRFYEKMKKNNPSVYAKKVDCTKMQSDFSLEDFIEYGVDYDNVNVYDVKGMPREWFNNMINSEDVNICAWCYSERSSDVTDALIANRLDDRN